MKVSRPHHSVIRIDVNLDDLPDKTLPLLLRSCAHCDHPANRWDREQLHLEMIKSRNGYIIDLGDMFDAMQGRFDPRADPGSIIPEMVGADYADRLVEYAYRRYSPYARSWLAMLSGNHETKFEKNYGSNLTRRLGSRLEGLGSPVQVLDYTGYLVLGLGNGGAKTRFVMRLMHGSGGNAPATAGAAKDIYRSATYVDADIIATGHIHQDRTRKTTVERLNHSGIPYWTKQAHIVCPGYKDESTATKGWAVEKEMKPGPVGAYLLTFQGLKRSSKNPVSESFAWTYHELE